MENTGNGRNLRVNQGATEGRELGRVLEVAALEQPQPSVTTSPAFWRRAKRASSSSNAASWSASTKFLGGIRMHR